MSWHILSSSNHTIHIANRDIRKETGVPISVPNFHYTWQWRGPAPVSEDTIIYGVQHSQGEAKLPDSGGRGRVASPERN